MLRGAAGAWLGLVVLQGLTSKGGAGAVGGLLGTVTDLIDRALSPTVPAIPDHSIPLGVLPSDQGTAGSGDSSPKLNPNGGLVPGDPNGAPGGGPKTPLTPTAYVPGIPGTTTA